MENSSVFQAGNLDVENPQSREEDEELEEQRRRQEELADLLADGIHAFNYDESTINSSSSSCEAQRFEDNPKIPKNSSLISIDNLAQTYRDAPAEDQLKILYDVRVREINKLTEEFNRFQTDKAQEISNFKTKLTLSEAEIRHLQLAVKNLEGLLVEKTSIIKNFEQVSAQKDREILDLNKNIETMKMELISYTSTIKELQLKVSDSNPFSSSAKHAKSEEVQKSQQEQVVKLQALLEEQTKRTKRFEKENHQLKDEFKLLKKQKEIDDEENNFTIRELSKKLQSTQEQCRDLFVLGEAIKKESDHFKERVKQNTNNIDLSSDSFKNKSFDKETLLVHQEKLKKMLLDKDKEMTTLQAQLKFYNSDIEELFHYRQILSKLSSGEIKNCSNKEHGELLIFMQGQLQSYEQAIEDRNKQILNLNQVNKELHEKIEEMIEKTRAEIKNLSQRYSLPQLETMSNELKNAENTINELRNQLEAKDKYIDEILVEVNKIQAEKTSLKKNVEEMERYCRLLEAEKQEMLLKLEETKARRESTTRGDIEELVNVKTMLEGEKFALEYQLKSIINELDNVRKNESESKARLDQELEECKKYAKIVENTKNDLETQLENLQKQLNEAKTETLQLQKEICEINEKATRKSIVKELKDVENVLEKQHESEKSLIKSNELFQSCLQAEILKTELVLRDEIKKEALTNIKKIESHYKNVLEKKIEEYKDERARWQKVENEYRNHFATIFEECGKKMLILEERNAQLSQDLQNVVREYENYRRKMIEYCVKCHNAIKGIKNDKRVERQSWQDVTENIVDGYCKIQVLTKKNIETVVDAMETYEDKVRTIEKKYNKQIIELKQKVKKG